MWKKETDRLGELDLTVFICSVIVLGFIIFCLFLWGDKLDIYINRVFSFITYSLGGFFILAQVVTLAVCVWLVFGRFSGFRIGGDKAEPQYKEFSWAAMIVCTGIAGATLVYAFVEPLWYLTDTPFGIEPLSEMAYEYAHMYGQFHWGILQWIPYVPTSVLISYIMYNKNKNVGKLSSVFDAKNKGVNIILDVLSVFAIVGGVGTSMGLCIPLINKMLIKAFGFGNEDYTPILYFFITIIFLMSVWRGFEKGIKTLSNINAVVALLFIFAIATFAGYLNILNTELNSVGLMLRDFTRMFFYTQPYGDSFFPQRWTVFYWGWFYAYIPLLALFIAKVSKGRTIRHITLGICGYGSLGALLAFVILGYYSLHIQSTGDVDLVSILGSQGKEDTVMAILGTLPLSNILKMVFLIISMLFLATTIDSSAYVISMICCRKLNQKVDTPRWSRVFWALLLALFAIILGRIEKLELIQTMAVLTGFPMLFVVLFCSYKIIKTLKNIDCGT